MKTYRVWIEQINQTYIDVKADEIKDAIFKAKQRWRDESCPEILDIIELTSK
jgi:hypothetical protein